VCIFSFKDGLRTLGVLDAIVSHDRLFEPLMCHAGDPVLTAKIIQDAFVPTMSAVGSSKRNVENDVYSWWLDLLQDIEGMCM